MMTKNGSLKIFTIAGIGVYVHWMWLVAAVLTFQVRTHVYSSLVWNVIEYLSLFGIVLIHEFGHQLACRQVGGKTQDIVLWLLGGVAYVSPPQRPGAQLWSIAAGPLVNVVLVPIFALLWSASFHLNWDELHPDAYEYLKNVWYMNIGLLIFNMLPVYPLDGGQILRSLLWYPFGRARSLLIVSIIGFIGLAALLIFVGSIYLKYPDAQGIIWLCLMTAFIATRCWSGLRQALALSRIDKLPRREGYACPACKSVPLLGERWRCAKCGKPFDIFLNQGTCSHCATQYSGVQCLDCGNANPIAAWQTTAETGARSAE